MFRFVTLGCASLLLMSAALSYGQDAPPPYGEAITLAQAKKVMAAAEAEAIKNKWPVVIAIVDDGGHLVMLQRLENTQLGSIDIALGKAKTSALFRRPTKAFQDGIEKGGINLRILAIPNATPLEGGIPIIHEGKVIGAIGVSGVQSFEDAQIGQAGIDALTQ